MKGTQSLGSGLTKNKQRKLGGRPKWAIILFVNTDRRSKQRTNKQGVADKKQTKYYRDQCAKMPLSTPLLQCNNPNRVLKQYRWQMFQTQFMLYQIMFFCFLTNRPLKLFTSFSDFGKTLNSVGCMMFEYLHFTQL